MVVFRLAKICQTSIDLRASNEMKAKNLFRQMNFRDSLYSINTQFLFHFRVVSHEIVYIYPSVGVSVARLLYGLVSEPILFVIFFSRRFFFMRCFHHLAERIIIIIIIIIRSFLIRSTLFCNAILVFIVSEYNLISLQFNS